MIPSSASDALALQVNSVPVYTPVLGVMAALSSKIGAVLMMVKFAESEMEAELLSVRVTAQEITSSGLAMLASS